MDVMRDKTVRINVYFAGSSGSAVVTKLTQMVCRKAGT